VTTLLDDEMWDFVNLVEADTGVPGTIFMSTEMGDDGPRIIWRPGGPAADGPHLLVSLEDSPRAINRGLAEPDLAVEPQVVAWVLLNRVALMRYWQNGITWYWCKVKAFVDGLAKLP
jgi:hypothetical protein